ncbi:MAG: DUF47 family protein [Elusimicrobia bacterium]|nr:DUF47 family protein [Candidatus Obscuribacterium magneticum]
MSFFKKKRANFFNMLTDQANKVEEGLKALVIFMKDPHPLHGETVLRLEEEADVLRKNLVDELNQTFVTPIDREDIYALSRVIDDIVDYAKSTVEEMMAFQVTPNKHMVVMSEGLLEAASAIAEAVSSLKMNKEKAIERVVYAKKRENFVEHCYREALVELFKEENLVAVLKMREIYRHLSNAADHGDEAANIIGNIIVKST